MKKAEKTMSAKQKNQSFGSIKQHLESLKAKGKVVNEHSDSEGNWGLYYLHQEDLRKLGIKVIDLIWEEFYSGKKK